MLSNSWIIVSKATGQSVCETWLSAVVDAVNTDRYVVLTAHDYLVRLNKAIKAGTAPKVL